MFLPGLVSVTFRNLDVPAIAKAAAEAGLSAIEWGGDVHVPPSGAEKAKLAARLTAEAGLHTASYGSYYRCNGTEEDVAREVNAAVLLSAPNLRVWAGTKGSADVSADERASVVENLRQVCRAAAVHGMTVSPEFHQGTLTDHYESAVRLAEEVGEDNLRLYWQPNPFRDDKYNLAAIRAVLPYLSNLHVFTWSEKAKFPLSDGERLWRQVLETAASDSSDGRDHHLLLEFVCDGTVEQMKRDAETLRGWIR